MESAPTDFMVVLKFVCRGGVLISHFVSQSYQKPSLAREGGPLAVEGACETKGGALVLKYRYFFRYALSLKRLRRQLPPGGSLFMCSPCNLVLSFLIVGAIHKSSLRV